MQKHLHIQIFIVLFVAAVFIAIISSIFTFKSTHKKVLDTYQHISMDLLATVEETASLACYLGQEDMMNDVVEGLCKNRIVAGVSLVNSDGLMVQKGAKLHKIIQDNKYIIKYPLMPLFKSDTNNLGAEEIGELVLLQNQLLIEQRAKESALRDGLSIIQLTFLTIFLASFLVYIFFTKSIRSIAMILHDTKAGSLDILDCPARHLKNEIGSLISDINALLKKNADALHAERALRKRLSFLEKRYRMIFEQANSAIFLADKNGKVIISNPFFRKLAQDTGKEQLVLRNFTQLFPDVEKAKHLIKTTLAKKHASSADMLISTNKSSQIWVHAVFINCEDDEQPMIEGMLYDITQRRIEEEQTRNIATKDHLTGLLNRRGGEIRIDQIFSSCEPEDYIAFFLMDLDGFKRINDTYGHDAGDKVLIEVSARLLSVNRATDTILRWGGDEFVLVLCGDINRETCFGVAEKILYAISSSIDLGSSLSDSIGASIGISLMSVHNTNKEVLIKCADKAMYEIKNKGKNGICYCENNSNVYETKFF